YRRSPEAIRQIRVTTPSGASVPLGLVTDIKIAEGASYIYHESLGRYVPLRFAVHGRDLKSAIEDARGRVAREAKLPHGVHLQWAGEYGELEEANRRLMIVVPFALVLIAGVL